MRDAKGSIVYVRHNILGNKVEDFKKAFYQNEKNRKYSHSNANVLYHEFVAFNPEDSKHLSLEILKDLTQKYFELRAPTGMGMAVFHNDKHRHAHILLSAVELETGRALHLSKSEFDKVKRDLQAYQIEKYPELAASIIDFDRRAKQRISDKERQMKNRTGKPTRKEELQNILQLAFEKSITLEDLYSNISREGLAMYERGRTKGIADGDKHYRLSTLLGEEKLKELSNGSERLNELNELRQHEDQHHGSQELESKDEARAFDR